MSEISQPQQAKLLLPSGSRYELGVTCFIGRAVSGNDLILDQRLSDSQVSRWHALIHRHGNQGYWLIDLGSTYGTFHNDRAVTHPTFLSDGDQIRIGEHSLAFQFPLSIPAMDGRITGTATVHEVGSHPLWLLVADLVGFTSLSGQHPPAETAELISRWFTTCLHLIERSRGRIDKFLGDGFLAVWEDSPSASKYVRRAIEGLTDLAELGTPEFRIVLHKGNVSRARVVKGGEFELIGEEINLVFRMEKLASRLGFSCLLSSQAHDQLDLPGTHPVGKHPLKGFENPFDFYHWKPSTIGDN